MTGRRQVKTYILNMTSQHWLTEGTVVNIFTRTGSERPETVNYWRTLVKYRKNLLESHESFRIVPTCEPVAYVTASILTQTGNLGANQLNFHDVNS